jgi:hypothetical protein
MECTSIGGAGTAIVRFRLDGAGVGVAGGAGMEGGAARVSSQLLVNSPFCAVIFVGCHSSPQRWRR